jgi:hypothetical protein
MSWDPYVAAGRELNMSSISGGGVTGLGGSSIVSEREVDSGTVKDWGEDE